MSYSYGFIGVLWPYYCSLFSLIHTHRALLQLHPLIRCTVYTTQDDARTGKGSGVPVLYCLLSSSCHCGSHNVSKILVLNSESYSNTSLPLRGCGCYKHLMGYIRANVYIKTGHMRRPRFVINSVIH
jgi:hypothetical protein